MSGTLQKARQGLDDLATGGTKKPIHPQYLTRLINETATHDAIFTADVGTPTVWAARYLKMNGQRRLMGSFVHGSMANALPQAIGAQVAQPNRQIISLSGDGGFTMLMGDLLTLVQEKLPIKLIIYNNGTLGFVAMEMKAAGYLETGVSLQNPDFAMCRAMGIHAVRAETPPNCLLLWTTSSTTPALPCWMPSPTRRNWPCHPKLKNPRLPASVFTLSKPS